MYKNGKRMNSFTEDIEKIETIIKVKESTRFGIVGDRFESSAEHTFSCILLAQYFIKKIPYKLDELKVIKLLSYHDIQNVFFKDINLSDDSWSNKKDLEKVAFKKTINSLPSAIAGDYEKNYLEFEGLLTTESRFAKAIDVLEPVIHAYNQKKHWKEGKWTESKLRMHKEKYLDEFPVLLKFFNDFVDYANQNDYFYKE
jgi:putative hydrolases of HD superfamily